MNKYMALVILLMVGIGIAVAVLRTPTTTPSLADAQTIATAQGSECVQKGKVGDQGTYNENSKTWWIDFTPKPEYAKNGCSPACVVDTVAKSAEINWRCTGASVPASYEDLLQVNAPLPSAEITSPLTVSGKARGQWYFEASFPVSLYDANGKLIGQVPAQAESDWMTTEYVPFSTTLFFSSDTATGTLVLQNDNPSGLPENQKELKIPVTFVNAFSSEGAVTRNNPGQKPNVWYFVYERPGSPALSLELDLNSMQNPMVDLAQGARVRATGTIRGTVLVVQSIQTIPANSSSIKLYFYNPTLDQGPDGAQCTKAGLVAVDRVIPKTSTPLKDSIQLLLKGQLSAEEKARGITTEFPLQGVTLASATIQNGAATLTFVDPQNKTGGGSCRTAILWAQIEATAKQFPTVQSVRYMPEELFQP